MDFYLFLPQVSGRRENFTEPVRERLLEEISTSNPSFPAQRFFTRFLKRHNEYVQAAFAGKNVLQLVLSDSPFFKLIRVNGILILG